MLASFSRLNAQTELDPTQFNST